MNRLLLFISLITILLITSCEDVIDIDLEEASGDLVIDAWIDNRNQAQEIRLTLSQAYFDNQSVSAAGAKVTIINETQQETFIFDETNTDGIYRWSPDSRLNIGSEGDVLNLNIDFNGVSYTASSTINRVPVIDSIGQEFRDDELFSDDGIYAQFFARDFEGAGDAYWIKTYKNGEFFANADQLNIAYDAGFDAGSRIDGLIFIPPIREFVNDLDEDGLPFPWQVGEEIMVEIHSISIPAFNFLEIARDQILNGDNSIFTLPLANARSNISKSDGGAALGFFNVAQVSSLTDVIVEQ